jgi:predicted ester cyclase
MISLTHPGGRAVPDSSSSTNHALATRFISEALAAGNQATFRELVHPDVVVHSGLEPTRAIRGIDDYWRALGRLAAFSFEDFELQDLLAVEDRTIARFRAHARHTGDQLGVPATGTRILMWEIHLMRWRDGKLIENVVADVNYDWPWLIAPAYPGMIGKTGEA